MNSCCQSYIFNENKLVTGIKSYKEHNDHRNLFFMFLFYLGNPRNISVECHTY